MAVIDPPPTSMRKDAPALVRAWGRFSRRAVPVLAVITALLVTVPFMVLTGARGNIARGFQIAGTAYAGLLEGALGIAINDRATVDDFNLALAMARETGVETEDVGRLARSVSSVVSIGLDETLELGALLERLGLDAETADTLGERIVAIQTIGLDTLRVMAPLITDLEAADRGEVRTVAEAYRRPPETLTPEARADIEALAPAAADYSDEALIRYMALVDEYGVVTLFRTLEAITLLEDNDIDPTSAQAQRLVDVAMIGADDVMEDYEIAQTMQAAGVLNGPALEAQLRQLDRFNESNLFTAENLATALEEELPELTRNNLIVRRPGDRVLVAEGSTGLAGITFDRMNTPDDPTDDEPDTVWVRLGDAAFLFFPRELEGTLVRSMAFIIAGLAVALGFKAGLFNIGAEGQLYAGAVAAVFFGYAVTGLPQIIHVPLVVFVGIMGGIFWGSIPGALKAYTGAHEVITTIMLNFIAIRFVDWLVKTPGLMLDPEASTPRTPFVLESARLAPFDQPVWMFIGLGVLVTLFMLYLWRDRINQPRAIGWAVAWGVFAMILGVFLAWITVRDRLHMGLLLMLFAVWFVDWFLNRTTLGFEMRTVGSNPDAARYAGMSVKRNIILAMAMSGGLAGLAGTIEVSGVQYNLQPAFFSGLGFDAIAVALLARTNPRNMIPAGLLWGGLYAGAPLMQTRADISIDLVRIIQALIIMFVAADAIIRYVWRVPEATNEEKAAQMFSTRWGG